MKSLIIIFTLIGSLTLITKVHTGKLKALESSSIELNDPCGCAADFLQCKRDNPGYQGLINCLWDYDYCELSCSS